MNISAATADLSRLAAAQTMFDGTARAAASVAGDGDPPQATASSPPTSVGVAVLRMALDSERSLVDILA